MKNFQHLVELIEFLERKYCLNICIKDYIGFIPINKCLDTALAPYLAHSNPYCLFVKQDRKRWFKCLSMIRPMYNKCIASNDGFFGICHAGIYEYVLPIKLDGKVLGSINIGHFPGKEKESALLIQRLFHENGTTMLERACQIFHREYYCFTNFNGGNCSAVFAYIRVSIANLCCFSNLLTPKRAII